MSNRNRMIDQVGDLVASRFPEWIVADRRGCSCKSKRRKMNVDGPDQVETELESWIDYFLEQKKHLRKSFQTIPDAALRIWLGRVIRHACKVSRERRKK